MAMQQTICTSSSSSLKKYDVFISFRGEDTRRKFTSYLYDALSKKVLTFIDEKELEKGDEISTLFNSIEEAYVSVVIFSQDYASSKWCLNELVKILECKKDRGQIVIPVFYEIDPSHVRYQIGSYGEAFEKHEQDLRLNNDKLQKWRTALTEASNLFGWNSGDYRIESNLIKNIVEDVFKKLNRKLPFEVNKDIVGIEKKYEEIELLLKTGSADVRTLGLWGMGGIGKTTLAEYAYAKLSFQFERRCLLENVREESTKRGLLDVRKLLLSKMFEFPPNVETRILERRLAGEKSLIVLDDVATLQQAENLNMCLGPGSRIIVTTRDKQIFSQFNQCEIYEVEGLDKDDSLQLFCWHAFQEKHAKVGYEELLERAIGYCGGNPLALKVLGTNFRTKSKEVWKSELEKLKEIPNRTIHDVLKLSFNDLDHSQQDIFLDIACFFKLRYYSDDIDNDLLITVLLDACNFHAVSGIEALCNKALITREPKQIEMHDLLVEMGREIVNGESRKDPGRRSRLWDSKDVYDVLKYSKGTKYVEVISFQIDISKIENLYLSSDAFKSMINLRYLHITYNVYHTNKAIVVLKMTRGKLRKLWNGTQNLDNLMTLDLEFSKDLIEIPDLSRAPNLEIVILSSCESLNILHPSVFTCPKLRKLLLSDCIKIKSLKTNIHSKSLQVLILSDCYSLVEFSVTSEEMTWLSLRGTAIREFPSSIWRNSKLTQLFLDDCQELKIVVHP